MSYNKDSGMYEGYIYCITNQVNGKQYIGQTIRTVEKRWTQHKSHAKTNKNCFALHTALQKYGIDNFKIECVEKIEVHTKNELYPVLNKIEKMYIEKYNSLSPCGYNLAKESYIKRESVVSKNLYKPVVQYDLDGNKIMEYESIIKASKNTGASAQCISDCCNNRKWTAFGFRWGYKNKQLNNFNSNRKNINLKMVDQYDMDGVFIRTYESIKQASLENNINYKCILRVCNGKSITSNNYIWRFTGDLFDKYRTKRDEYTSVNQYNLDGIFIKSYEGIIFASMETGIKSNCITQCCKSKTSHAGGYIWRYVNDEYNVINNKKSA